MNRGPTGRQKPAGTAGVDAAACDHCHDWRVRRAQPIRRTGAQARPIRPAALGPMRTASVWPSTPALAEWSRTALIVPPGHPRSGEPRAIRWGHVAKELGVELTAPRSAIEAERRRE